MMIKEVIIAEKPNTAKKIAYFLKSKEIKIERHKKVPVYILKEENKEIVVLSAVGHLFSLTTDIKNTYPVFEVYWTPVYKKEKDKKYVKDYIEVLEKYGSNADKYIIATDFDIEGETIGYNILKHIFKKEDAERMKFSTLTKREITVSYKNRLKHILKNTAIAGITRHILDFYYGINLSRGLMSSIRKVGKYQTLSIGRVQGPALALLVEREKKIKSFVPEKYYTIEGVVEKNIKIKYIEEKIKEKDRAEKIFSEIKNEKYGVLEEIKTKEISIAPPTPYNLTDLQTDAYNIYKITPQQTLNLAQKLYEKSLISYPRTSSQKIPPNIPVKEILKNISQIKEYKEEALGLLRRNRTIPNNGKKEDEAHPAIYPTGEVSEISTLTKDERKIFDLVVRRFLSTLDENAKKKIVKGKIKIKQHLFTFELQTISKKGWMKIYEDILKENFSPLPELKNNALIKINSIDLLEKETQPPKRYSPASLIKELEKRKLGTKATRAMIIETLYKRKYIKGKNSIEVTPLGMVVYEIMEKYMPQILSETLTRKIEEELEKLEKGETKKEIVLENAKRIIHDVCKVIKEKEKDIGKILIESYYKTQKEEKTIGKCMGCGGDLVIKTYKRSKRFVGCSNYPECSIAYTIPQKGKITSKVKLCDTCHNYVLTIKTSNKKSYQTCLSPTCKNNIYKKLSLHNNNK